MTGTKQAKAMTYAEQEKEHFADMARDGAIEDAGISGDLRGIVSCLRSGNIDESILSAAASIIETQVMKVEQRNKAARRDRDFWRSMEIRQAYDYRERGMFDDTPIANPKTFEELGDELAEKFGITRRRVEQILAASGYKRKLGA